MTNKRGFTITEILVVVGILGLLVAIATPTYAMIKRNVGLKNATQELVTALDAARERAIASQGPIDPAAEKRGLDHYVRVTDTTFQIFNELDEPVSSLYAFTDVTVLVGAGDVHFQHLTGRSAARTIELGYTPAKKVVIDVTATGSVSVN